jgi:hypothetical protein
MFRQHLHVTGLSDNATGRKCGHADEVACNILLYCSASGGNRKEIIASAWLELMDIRRTLLRLGHTVDSVFGMTVHPPPSKKKKKSIQ